jgi:hypothetical protein
MKNSDYESTPEILEAMGYDAADLGEFLRRQTLRQRFIRGEHVRNWWMNEILRRRGGWTLAQWLQMETRRASIVLQNFVRDEQKYRACLADTIIAYTLMDETGLEQYASREFCRGELNDRLLYWCRELGFRKVPGAWSRHVRAMEGPRAQPISKQKSERYRQALFNGSLRTLSTSFGKDTFFQQAFQGRYLKET